jgi:hypothetical protein
MGMEEWRSVLTPKRGFTSYWILLNIKGYLISKGADMSDLAKLIASGSSHRELSERLTEILQELPPETAKRFHKIRLNYTVWYGFAGMYERMNGRTVEQIFTEYRPVDEEPIASGEVDGLRYKLYEAPPNEPTTNRGGSSNEEEMC